MPVKATDPVDPQNAEADHAAAYDAWFRSEVEAAIREAEDPNCVWVSQEEVSERLARFRREGGQSSEATDPSQ